MSDELHIDYPSSYTVYAVIRNAAGNVWYVAGQVFEAWGTSGDMDDYDIAMVDKSGSRYVGDMDTNIPAGLYSIQLFRQAGGSPADSDRFIGGRQLRWTGAAERSEHIALETTVASVTTADTVFRLTAGSADDDAYNNMVVMVEDVSANDARSRRVTNYTGSTKEVTVDADFAFAIAAGDIVRIWASTYSQTADAAAIGDIVDAVWEEADADHMTQGTKGLKVHHAGKGRY